MDNLKTGSLIKEARKDKGMTQKDLADILNITDRAVSKWERGLCAPDIALLEPLAQALDLTILELIAGERAQMAADPPAIEECAKAVIDYSTSEINEKKKRSRKVSICVIMGIAALVFLCCIALIRSGYPFIIDRCTSPNGLYQATVYRKELTSDGFTLKDSISVIIDMKDSGGCYRIAYGPSEYLGISWAPDSKKYVMTLRDEAGTRLLLSSMTKSSESNLSAYLTMCVESTELSKYGYVMDGAWPEISYQFLQWTSDSEAMLIHYSFADPNQELHEGYFWYHCSTGEVDAILELSK